MTAIDLSLKVESKGLSLPHSFPLIDTHTHFDAPVFDEDRSQQAQQAYGHGVRHLVLVGYLARHFDRLYETQQALMPSEALMATSSQSLKAMPQTHIALGLHPFYIEQHTDAHLEQMTQLLEKQRPLAIGEIGLDTFTDIMKQPEMLAKQQRFFNAQLDMAVSHQLPVMLHIRKAHAEALSLLKAHDYNAHKLGGIAHSFSGGEQEAKAFVKLGFKLGVTGQVTNPNAKKLRRAIQAAVANYGVECLVIETDCPDMTPIMCQISNPSRSALGQSTDNEWQGAAGHNRNVPANLPWVLYSLSELLNVAPADLARQLWQNSCDALHVTWAYPHDL
ncbi:TatD family deoxyribonuclease [Psychrobacter frigidicola]|uniref:TatD family deoxyribonuclease n=1 Tax=Psychrobacter frigidicola TaxID=45611 RepID=A0A5C7ACG1_9GAMM|nr:TatD family hydrolase [Psychrobacter frigidicola]TXD98503.1 TatD family deoxyribonuclease [Psychrobacter frigidicola]